MESTKDKKVLIVDRSEVCSMLVKNQLTSIGIIPENIVVLNEGQDVLTKAKQELFDIILIEPYTL